MNYVNIEVAEIVRMFIIYRSEEEYSKDKFLWEHSE